MADSTKLRRKSAMIVAALENVRTLVTDDGASAEELEVFREAGINVIVASLAQNALRQQGA
jgi:DeoR/GlpR family transcriptional regulator of sugar metabolism